jgi:hypothetical protein
VASETEHWQVRDDGSAWIVGTSLQKRDVPRLREIRYITLYNTTVGQKVLGELSQLELLEMRTTSVSALEQIRDLPSLRGLALRHNRGVSDLSAVGSLVSLEFLDLYALSKVTSLPNLSRLSRLRRVNLGQMIRLTDWSALGDLPGLETLELLNELTPDLAVLRGLAGRDQFKHFIWNAPDEPLRIVESAALAADRPKPDYQRIADLWKYNVS